jgi:hypothetical protein
MLNVGLGVCSLALVARLLERTGLRRTEALSVIAAVAVTGIGTVWFADTGHFFDGLALTALVLALASRNPLLVFVSISAAAWTDERALLAAVIVAAFHLRERQYISASAVGLALLGYCGLRVGLAMHFGLATDRTFVGPSVLRSNLYSAPLALFLAIEALWGLLLIGIGAGALSRDRTVWIVAPVALASSLGAVMVYDVTRSAAYLLPALVVAGAYLAKQSVRLRTPLIGWCAVLCAVIPTTVIISYLSIPVLLPLPIQTVAWLGSLLV